MSIDTRKTIIHFRSHRNVCFFLKPAKTISFRYMSIAPKKNHNPFLIPLEMCLFFLSARQNNLFSIHVNSTRKTTTPFSIRVPIYVFFFSSSPIHNTRVYRSSNDILQLSQNQDIYAPHMKPINDPLIVLDFCLNNKKKKSTPKHNFMTGSIK